MKLFRIGLLIALIALVAFVPFTAKAQDGCLEGLSAEDCALANAVMSGDANYNQFVMDWTFTAKSSGLQATAGGEIDVTVTGGGAVDASTVQADPAKPESIFNGLKFSINMTAAAALPGQPAQSGDLEVRIVDGKLYAKGTEATKGEWWTQSVEKAIQSGSGGAGMGDLTQQLQGALSNPAALGGMAAFTGMKGLVTGSATDGPTVDGVATREITANVALDVLAKGLTSEEFRPMLKQLLAQAGLGAMIPDEQLAQLSMLVAGFEPTLKATKLSFSQYVGKEDKLFHGFALRFSLNVDANQAAMFQLPGALNVDVVLDVRLSKIGTAPEIVAPEGAIEK